MKVYLILLINFKFIVSQLPNNESLLVFSIENKGLFTAKFEKTMNRKNESDSDFLAEAERYLIGEIDYSLSANVVVWREWGNEFYVNPIDESKTNSLRIKNKTKLMEAFDRNPIHYSNRLSIDWIHSLVYYNEDNKIIVFNMTDTKYEFVVIEKENQYITDLSVNPLDSTIFYVAWNGTQQIEKIMKSSQDGSNQIILKNDSINLPLALTIDLVSKKVFWFEQCSKTFSSIDFDGNNFIRIDTQIDSFGIHSFMEIFDDYIFWIDHYGKAIFKMKLGKNGTQTNYFITSENNTINSFKIIDSSLQSNFTNRCINSNCTHLCIPISIDQYRCVCPQFKPLNDTQICIESINNISSIGRLGGSSPTWNSESTITSTSENNKTISNDISYDILFQVFLGLFVFLLISVTSVAFCIYLFRRRNRQKTRQNSLAESKRNKPEEKELDDFVPSIWHLLDDEIPDIKTKIKREFCSLYRKDKIFINRYDLILEDCIGRGNYGSIYKGKLKSADNKVEEVAVKRLENISDYENGIKLFLEEGLIMKEFNHSNVLMLRGICFGEDDLPIILTPFMANGDLFSYIRNVDNFLTIRDLLQFAVEIANGMDYLSKQRYVHRDLAARNCLLDSNLCVKIADFGLSRDIYENDYYRIGKNVCKLPIKWMPPESIEKQIFNTKTDVWSYGVLVWELFTRGMTPYPQIDNNYIFDHLKRGNRLPKTNYCPEPIYVILLKCWSENPKSRPSFAILSQRMKFMIDNLVEAQNHNYEYININ